MGCLSHGRSPWLMRQEAETDISTKERGIIMSKNVKNTTSTTSTVKTTTTTTSPMSAQEFKLKSYNAYLSYVAFIEGKQSITETVEALSPFMSAYGFTLTVDNLANLLTVKMTAYGKDKGEQAKKVKSISTFRAFVKGGWKDVSAAPVHFSAGKNPADAKPAKAKKPTKAEMEAEIAQLRSMLAAQAKATAETTETKADDAESKAA